MPNTDRYAIVVSIAHQLGYLYDELATRREFSIVAGIRIADAEAFGRAARMYLLECDSNDLVLTSMFRRWWQVDERGFSRLEEWPISRERAASQSFTIESPYIKFATNGLRVRFGMRFGPRWYAVREGTLGPGGQIDPGALVSLSDP